MNRKVNKAALMIMVMLAFSCGSAEKEQGNDSSSKAFIEAVQRVPAFLVSLPAPLSGDSAETSVSRDSFRSTVLEPGAYTGYKSHYWYDLKTFLSNAHYEYANTLIQKYREAVEVGECFEGEPAQLPGTAVMVSGVYSDETQTLTIHFYHAADHDRMFAVLEMDENAGRCIYSKIEYRGDVVTGRNRFELNMQTGMVRSAGATMMDYVDEDDRLTYWYLVVRNDLPPASGSGSCISGFRFLERNVYRDVFPAGTLSDGYITQLYSADDHIGAIANIDAPKAGKTAMEINSDFYDTDGDMIYRETSFGDNTKKYLNTFNGGQILRFGSICSVVGLYPAHRVVPLRGIYSGRSLIFDSAAITNPRIGYIDVNNDGVYTEGVDIVSDAVSIGTGFESGTYTARTMYGVPASNFPAYYAEQADSTVLRDAVRTNLETIFDSIPDQVEQLRTEVDAFSVNLEDEVWQLLAMYQ